MHYLLICCTIAMTVYGQIVLKWQMRGLSLPEGLGAKALFAGQMLLNPWVISVVLAAFVAMLCWMVALTRFQLSYAYPFVSLTFVLVPFFSWLLLAESLSIWRVGGIALIVLGVVIGGLDDTRQPTAQAPDPVPTCSTESVH